MRATRSLVLMTAPWAVRNTTAPWLRAKNCAWALLWPRFCSKVNGSCAICRRSGTGGAGRAADASGASTAALARTATPAAKLGKESERIRVGRGREQVSFRRDICVKQDNRLRRERERLSVPRGLLHR